MTLSRIDRPDSLARALRCGLVLIAALGSLVACRNASPTGTAPLPAPAVASRCATPPRPEADRSAVPVIHLGGRSNTRVPAATYPFADTTEPDRNGAGPLGCASVIVVSARVGSAQTATYKSAAGTSRPSLVTWTWSTAGRDQQSWVVPPNPICRWKPAIADLEFPLHTGRTWTSSSRCVGGVPASVIGQLDEHVKVVGPKLITLPDGQRIDTIQLSESGKLRFGATSSPFTEITDYSPLLGIPVKDVKTQQAEGQNQVITRQLMSLPESVAHHSTPKSPMG